MRWRQPARLRCLAYRARSIPELRAKLRKRIQTPESDTDGDAVLLEAREVLSEIFGYPDFRPGQADAVAAVLSGRDAVVLLPTGSGKSICYQVPALVFRRHHAGTTLVVSPLIALMNDQVAALEGRGVRASRAS